MKAALKQAVVIATLCILIFVFIVVPVSVVLRGAWEAFRWAWGF